MIVTFWGVRGTIPTPGAHTVRYGGNTTSVSVEIEDKVLVIDAGSGIRPMGMALRGADKEIFLLLTHLHTDHLIGFPYFYPLYEPGRQVHLLDYQLGDQAWSLLALFDGTHFPLSPDDLGCSYHRVESDGLAYLRAQGFSVEAIPVNHPGGAFGYRLTHQGHRFVFIPDNELAASEKTTTFDEFVAFCYDADVLCHDAQYLADDMPAKHGWGHSCVQQVVDLAVAARVKHLILFHHDPERTDDDLDALQADARARLAPHGIACTAAYEGLTLDFSRVPDVEKTEF